MRVEVSHAAPVSDVESWDHVVELPLPVPSGTLVFQASGGGEPIETQISAGIYSRAMRAIGSSSGQTRRRNRVCSSTGVATT
jgi:hypothetical protein